MTSETDLSTADLAQPGGSRQPDRADDDQRDVPSSTGERTYETSGNRVVQDRGDEDAVEPASSGQPMGSTRDDAVRGAMPSTGGAGDTGDRSMGGQDMTDRDMAGQGATGRDMADRDMTDRDMTDRGAGERGRVDDGRDVALLDPAEGERFRQRWNDVQARFVDDPQEAVRSADGLVAEVVQSLAQGFSDHKHGLEQAWQSGGDPETEDLRLALQRYRSFFDRLLST